LRIGGVYCFVFFCDRARYTPCLMITKADMVRRLLDGRKVSIRPESVAFAPANIALCKYWGKRDIELNLPVTDSLSIALGSLGSRCRLAVTAGGVDCITLNGEPLAPAHPFAARLSGYLDLFRGAEARHFRVDAVNTVPTAAGFASSASGFASVVRALDALHGWNLPDRDLSILARLGSGSACRSLWQGFVRWHAGVATDGMDSYAEPLPGQWPSLRMGLLMVSDKPKAIGSTEAMRRTVETSSLYAAWPRQVAADMETIQQALQDLDFETLGSAAESNALAMHATMLAARPPVLYWHEATLAAMRIVWACRRDGLPVYFTMDAGPNLKLLFHETDAAAVAAAFSPGPQRAGHGPVFTGSFQSVDLRIPLTSPAGGHP
jgi:diphosphomevalonate decarboxylase